MLRFYVISKNVPLTAKFSKKWLGSDFLRRALPPKKDPGIPQSLLETEPPKSKLEIISKKIGLENMKSAPKKKKIS